MPEVINSLVADARKSRFSFLPNLSNEDVISVWDTVAEYVETQMRAQKGVTIPGLGTFTFVQKKLDIGNNKIILLQRPVFVLSEKFAQTHALQYQKHHTTGEIPVVTLNFTAISFESPFDRDVVETCVREVLQALSRAVSNLQGVEFLFRGVGVLYVKNSKVKMRFFKDFINCVDGSGHLLKLMENKKEVVSRTSQVEFLRDSKSIEDKSVNKKRPGTTDSVMSTQTSLSAQGRPGTSTLTLPKLNGARDLLPPIHEEGANRDENRVPLPPPLSTTDKLSEKLAKETGNAPDTGEPNQSHSPFEKGNNEDRIPTPPQKTTPRSTKSAPAGSPRKPSDTPVFETLNEPVPEKVAPEDKQADEVENRSLSTNSSYCSSPTNHHHHHRAGQELCYVCMQRGMRNIPVSFSEERRRKELEQDALLQQYQQMKDQEAILMDKANQSSLRQSHQKISAYNLGVAQGVREVKNTRNTDFVKSYVFQNRPLTPLRFYKQDEYNKALETQVKMKRSRVGKEKLDREFQERMEQVQLAEDLAAQRERFLREKAAQVSQYQRALSAQVKRRKREIVREKLEEKLSSLPSISLNLSLSRRYSYPNEIRSKPHPMPKSEPDSAEPVFGKFDANNAKLLEQRERSRNLLKDQLNTISQKKKDIILEQLTKQKEESKMLARTKQELIADRVGAQRRSFEMRRALEQNWRDHHRGKLSKEEQEKSRFRTPGMLLLQQTDPYRRCGQCQRGLHNCGESNIWSESRYIPGSRLMV